MSSMRRMAVQAILGTTLRETWRNPATVVVALGLSGLLFCVAVVADALTSSGESFSAAGAMTTSAGVIAAVVAGALGVRASDPTDPLGPAPEAVLCQGADSLRWGRWLGASLSGWTIATVPCAVILLLGVAHAGAGSALPALALEAAALSTFFAGLGLLLGAGLPTVAAHVGVVLVLFGLRLGIPSWVTGESTWALALPDLLRIGDHVGQGATGTALLAAGGVALQGAAMSLLAGMRTPH